MQINMREAKSKLSSLGQLAWEGEEIVIAKAGKPHLRLEPYRRLARERVPGGLEGQIFMSPEFDEPDEELAELIEKSRILPHVD